MKILLTAKIPSLFDFVYIKLYFGFSIIDCNKKDLPHPLGPTRLTRKFLLNILLILYYYKLFKFLFNQTGISFLPFLFIIGCFSSYSNNYYYYGFLNYLSNYLICFSFISNNFLESKPIIYN